MYWFGLQPGDVHLNVSSPGWAKHAWSNVYAPWIAEATVLVVNFARFDARALLDQMVRCGVSTFCAPPTVWRMLIQEDLGRWPVPLREALAAGEPLNPEVIEQVRRRLGHHGSRRLRADRDDGADRQHAGPAGQARLDGPPAAGLRRRAAGPDQRRAGRRGRDRARPLPAPARAHDRLPRRRARAAATAGGYYRTGDVATRDVDGYITYVGRTDDVFKASDYRISPFELESVLIEHEAVAEAAVVPSPDPMRLAVPKAYVTLAPGHEPTRETALAILRFAREHLAPYKRIRRLEFAELPKTISGKIRRVELRDEEDTRLGGSTPPAERATPSSGRRTSPSSSADPRALAVHQPGGAWQRNRLRCAG